MRRPFHEGAEGARVGNKAPCQGCAGVAASNASREARTPLTADGSNASRVFPRNAPDRFVFRPRTNNGWHDARVRLSRESPVSLLNQLSRRDDREEDGPGGTA